MKINTVKIGRLGENLAAKYLQEKGYTIVEQNYRTKYAEIDLVARRQNILVIVEVRTKTGEQYGIPEETLHWRKLRKGKKNAHAYAALKHWKALCRVDAICIVLGKNQAAQRITHYENI